MTQLRRILRYGLLVLAVIVAVPLLAAAVLYAWDALIGVDRPYERRAQPAAAYPELGVEWAMHPVDNPGDWLPNGLDPADVDGDGQLDYVTNYEFGGRIRVAFHPTTLQPAQPWPAADAGVYPDAESSAFGDLDGDGLPDIVVAHGIEHAGQPAGIRVLWGRHQAAAQVTNAATAAANGPVGHGWADGGDLPASLAGWQFLYVRADDIDGDGDMDIIAGGRAPRLAGESKASLGPVTAAWAGIRWFENPGDGSRDLGRWQRHDIDPLTRSGHGFSLGDLDGDGDLDLANCNADWDTPDDEENCAWYSNPGPAGYGSPWPAYEIYRGREFYGKEASPIADLDGDGRQDILTQVEDAIYWFRNLGPAAAGSPPQFTLVRIPKHPAARWRARALVVADLNGDGRQDIVSASIHNNGWLPQDRAALYWLEQSPAGWQTHVIKWGDGFRGLGEFNGEKWDQVIATDVDGDGDLDLMANVEEYNRLRAILAVVWFENPARP
jgi:hypothetical protein